MVISPNKTEKFDYLPFGKQLPQNDADQRTAYIGKELDTESELGELQHTPRSLHLDYARYPRKKRVEVPVLSLSKCGRSTTHGHRTSIV